MIKVMTFTFFTNCISPHQLPLAKQLIDILGVENYRYIYTDALTEERQRMGWGDAVDAQWCQQGDASHRALVDADCLMSAQRVFTIFKQRSRLDKWDIYVSERWFKPPLGFLRIFVPSYLMMAWRLVRLLLNTQQFYYYPYGIHAARDMARLVGFLNGDVRCLFRAPRVAFESRPGGAIVPLKEAIRAGVLSKEEVAFGKKHGFVQIPREHWGKVKPQKEYAKMRLWGYFVEPGKASTEHTENTEKDCQCGEKPQNTQKTQKECCAQTSHAPLATNHRTLRILWVGRMLKLKRVDALVKACASEALKEKVELHLYGHGPEEETLKRLAEAGNNVFFHDFVPVEQVRDLMRAHDVYVFSSNAGDGWGAVVSEALEEGMKVLGTVEAGSSATILPPTHLFKAGNVKRLIELLSQEIEQVSIGEWTAKKSANYFKKGFSNE